jgi:hypothetical protein
VRRPPLISLGIVVLTLAVLAGCGSGGGTTTLSKSDFIAKGDEICKRAHDQFAEVQKNPPSTAEGFATLTQKLIEISESELSQIRALDAPEEVQPALNRYLKARQQGIALLKKGLAAAKNDNPQAYAKAQSKVANGQVQRLKLAQAVGFNECSRVSTSTTAG